jgi:hypothetical protein
MGAAAARAPGRSRFRSCAFSSRSPLLARPAVPRRRPPPPPHPRKRRRLAWRAGGACWSTPRCRKLRGTPRSSTAERGRKLYERRDYLSASIELHKVVAGTSNDDAASRQWAEIELAATLYQLWLDAAAYSFLGRIMQAGEAHAAYREALPWLRAGGA